MEIGKLNSLVELYFKKCEEVNPNKPFLKWLKPGKSTYNWGDIKERIFKLSYKIKSLINSFDLRNNGLPLTPPSSFSLTMDLLIVVFVNISPSTSLPEKLVKYLSYPDLKCLVKF